jgi:hypothetical protein
MGCGPDCFSPEMKLDTIAVLCIFGKRRIKKKHMHAWGRKEDK